MASASGESVSIDEPTCSICLNVFTLPRQLQCMHSFCQKCLQDYGSKEIGIKGAVVEEFACPVCRAIINPPKREQPVEEWASSFPRSVISVIATSKVKVDRYCDACQYAGEFNTAEGFCVVCEEGLCHVCLQSHRKTKGTRDHKIISIDELTRPENHLRLAKGFGCPDHQDKRMEYYCQTHDAVCCADCFFVNHRTCENVLRLSEDLPSLLKELKPEKTIEQMKKIEKHMQTFIITNDSNISQLETTVKNLTADIRNIRKKFNEILDEIETLIKTEGNQIFKEEMIRRQEENHQCQILMNAVKSSHTFLESVLKYGTDTQKFLVSKKSISWLKSYTDQISEKYEEIESVTVHLELGTQVKEILSQDVSSLAKLQFKRDHKSFPCSNFIESILYSGAEKSLQESQIKLASVVEIHSPDICRPYYSGVVQLNNGYIMLADYNNMSCYQYISSYILITMDTMFTKKKLPARPWDMCRLNDHGVAVTLPDMKRIEFISGPDTETVKTTYPCYGVAAISEDQVVVTGRIGKKTNFFWSLVNRTGEEKCLHEFCCHRYNRSCVALNNSKSRVYISLDTNNAVYCFGLTDGIRYFVYTSNDLKDPRGIAVDIEDNVYVVGYKSNNIHKMSPEGTTLQVITSGVPQRPLRIFFDKTWERFIVTNDCDNQRKQLHLFTNSIS